MSLDVEFLLLLAGSFGFVISFLRILLKIPTNEVQDRELCQNFEVPYSNFPKVLNISQKKKEREKEGRSKMLLSSQNRESKSLCQDYVFVISLPSILLNIKGSKRKVENKRRNTNTQQTIIGRPRILSDQYCFFGGKLWQIKGDRRLPMSCKQIDAGGKFISQFRIIHLPF